MLGGCIIPGGVVWGGLFLVMQLRSVKPTQSALFACRHRSINSAVLKIQYAVPIAVNKFCPLSKF